MGNVVFVAKYGSEVLVAQRQSDLIWVINFGSDLDQNDMSSRQFVTHILKNNHENQLY